MKIKIPIIALIPVLIGIVLLCVSCSKKDDKSNQASNKATISIGEWNGNKYSNKLIKAKINLPDGWEKYSDKELADLMNLKEEELGKDNINNIIEKQPVYVMNARDLYTGATIMIMIEKENVTEEYYLESLKEQLEQEQTIDYKVSEIEKMIIAGEEYKTLNSEMTEYGIYQSYYINKKDDYIINIMTTTMKKNQQKQILGFFE